MPDQMHEGYDRLFEYLRQESLFDEDRARRNTRPYPQISRRDARTLQELAAASFQKQTLIRRRVP